MTDERVPEAKPPDPETQVESDPTVFFLPLQEREGPSLTREEAAHIGGIKGYALVVERGPNRGVTYLLKEGSTTVGRHPESDIFLDDVTVSRHHCRFIVGGDTIRVEDSGSTNGTYVNEVRVDQATLRAGDEVLIGRFNFIVAYGDG
ncbi:MAG TPA: FHA domain-containing protein [Acidimicrobiia bacterium]